MFPEALSEFHQATQLTNNFPFTLSAYGEALAESGDRGGAIEVLKQLQERAKTKYVSAYDIGILFAALGEKDHAFEWLEKAESERASFLPYITWDRRCDSLRDDPRFDKLLHQLGLTKAASAHLHPPDAFLH
jgi:tetratricopeptide (TPR) repeat protein